MHKKALKLKLVFLCVLLISVSLGSLHSAAINPSKNILILNSYHPGLEWTDNQTSSILKGLSKTPGEYYPYIEYMDWKNHPTLENLEILYQVYKKKYQDKKIDMIITTDDTALKFAVIHRKEIFSDAPIIFTGVNLENAESITKNEKNITGVIEKEDFNNTMVLIKKLYPDVENVYAIYDETESGYAAGKDAEIAIQTVDPQINFIKCTERTLKDVIHRINILPDNSVVLLTTYYNDTENTILGFGANARYIVENSKSIPIFATYNFCMGTGVIGGSLISGIMEGERASDICVDFFNSNKTELTKNFITTDTIEKVVDYNVMKKLGLNIKDLPEGYAITNKPVTIMDMYGNYVYGALAIFIILLLSIISLSYYIKRLFYFQKTLEDKNQEQKALYDELAASEEELQAQYEELNHTNEELQNTQEKLNYLAYHDQLTNLGNRASFLKYFDTISKSKNDGHGAIVMIDIDNFKRINDTLGHIFGDKLINAVGMKIQALLKYPFEVFRIGGDEFVITLPFCNSIEANTIIEFILADFKTPTVVEDNSFNLTLSMGAAFYPKDGRTSIELLRRADIAMYHSKETGKDRVTIFKEEMLNNVSRRREIEKNLETALENNEFSVYYQPQVNPINNEIWGFEALIRWFSPALGFVSPMEFIALAEEKQSIIPIGSYVLDQSCAFIKRINEKLKTSYKISVNASPVEIIQGDFVRKIFKTLDKYQLPYDILEIEVTESIMVESFDLVNDKLNQIMLKGIGIALDDFGTGYSSLSYIQKLPITTLKIDKSFIDDVPNNKIMSDLVKSIISIGKLLNLEVVTEGVEAKEQREYLAENLTDRIQGYYYAKPMSEEVIEAFLIERLNKNKLTSENSPCEK